MVWHQMLNSFRLDYALAGYKLFYTTSLISYVVLSKLNFLSPVLNGGFLFAAPMQCLNFAIHPSS